MMSEARLRTVGAQMAIAIRLVREIRIEDIEGFIDETETRRELGILFDPSFTSQTPEGHLRGIELARAVYQFRSAIGDSSRPGS